MKEARLKAAVRMNRTLSQAAMAELVSKELGRTLFQTQWSNYELGASEPPYDVVSAAAKVSELSPGYLAFGEPASGEIATADRLRGLTGEELDRADRRAAEESSPPKQAARGGRRKGGGKGRP